MVRQRKKHHFWRNLLILIVLFGIYLYWGNRSIETDEATFTSGALPAGFDGCRIVQLSDLHGKYFGKGNERLYSAVKAAAQIDGPVYLRLARLPSPVFDEQIPFEVGKANTFREGTDVAVFTCGIMVDECLQAAEKLAAEGISAAVINMHTIKPLDEQAVMKYASQCGAIATVEEHSVIGGLGDAIGDVLLRNRVAIPFEKIGVQDRFGQSGKPDDVLKEYGLDVDSITESLKKFVESK